MEVINAIGRRKAAVARVYVSEGKGNITINKRPLEEYFTLPTLWTVVVSKARQKPCVWVSPELWLKSMQKTNLN